MNQEHERRVCKAVICLMERRKSETLTFVCAPDTEEHQKKAVELVYRGRSTEFVFEHTRIESLPDQIGDQHRSAKISTALKERLSGTPLPQVTYILRLAPGATKLGKRVRDIDDILDALATWIRRTAPTLEIGSPATALRHCICETPPGVPFEVMLARWPPMANVPFGISLGCPPDLQGQTMVRMHRAMVDKCPKLHEARGTDRISVLVLGLDDMPLGSHTATGNALIAELPQWREQIPDEVYLVRTETSQQWQIWVLKEGTHWFPNVPDAGPHHSDPDQIMHC